ncbi:MAG: hypothetical protein PHS86_15280 [Syntrophaceae bacterium]|nr:hypothetical protein [Syntrophaceae bacterium]
MIHNRYETVALWACPDCAESSHLRECHHNDVMQEWGRLHLNIAKTEVKRSEKKLEEVINAVVEKDACSG